MFQILVKLCQSLKKFILRMDMFFFLKPDMTKEDVYRLVVPKMLRYYMSLKNCCIDMHDSDVLNHHHPSILS